MDLQTFGQLAVQAGHRRFVIVEVLDIAADQHIAPLDLRPQRLREVGDEEVDRQLGEDGIIGAFGQAEGDAARIVAKFGMHRSEEHTSELQSLMRLSYAVFCLKKKKTITTK